MKITGIIILVLIALSVSYILLTGYNNEVTVRISINQIPADINNMDELYGKLTGILFEKNYNEITVIASNGHSPDTICNLSEPYFFGDRNYFYEEVIAAMDSYMNFPGFKVNADKPGSSGLDYSIKTDEDAIDVFIGMPGLKDPGKVKQNENSILIGIFDGKDSTGYKAISDMYRDSYIISAEYPEESSDGPPVKVDIVILSPFSQKNADKLAGNTIDLISGNADVRILSANHLDPVYTRADNESFDFFLSTSLSNTGTANLDDVCRLLNNVAEECLEDSLSAMRIFVFGSLPEAVDRDDPSLICLNRFTEKIAELKGRANIDFITFIESGDDEFPLHEDFYRLLKNNELRLTKLEI